MLKLHRWGSAAAPSVYLSAVNIAAATAAASKSAIWESTLLQLLRVVTIFLAICSHSASVDVELHLLARDREGAVVLQQVLQLSDMGNGMMLI